MLLLQSMFFDGWDKLGRSLVLAILAYGSLVILLRFAGKRTLSKMNVFDFVFVVALGSTLASTILNTAITLADGLAAFVALMSLQIFLSWLCVTSHRVDHFVNGDPALVFYRGDFLNDALKRERVTKEEIRAAVRITAIRRSMTSIRSSSKPTARSACSLSAIAKIIRAWSMSSGTRQRSARK